MSSNTNTSGAQNALQQQILQQQILQLQQQLQNLQASSTPNPPIQNQAGLDEIRGILNGACLREGLIEMVINYLSKETHPDVVFEGWLLSTQDNRAEVFRAKVGLTHNEITDMERLLFTKLHVGGMEGCPVMYGLEGNDIQFPNIVVKGGRPNYEVKITKHIGRVNISKELVLLESENTAHGTIVKIRLRNVEWHHAGFYQVHITDSVNRRFTSNWIKVEIATQELHKHVHACQEWYNHFVQDLLPFIDFNADKSVMFFDEIDLVIIPPSFYMLQHGWLIVFDKIENVFWPFETKEIEKLREMVTLKTILMRGITTQNIHHISDDLLRVILQQQGIDHNPAKTRHELDALLFDAQRANGEDPTHSNMPGQTNHSSKISTSTLAPIRNVHMSDVDGASNINFAIPPNPHSLHGHPKHPPSVGPAPSTAIPTPTHSHMLNFPSYALHRVVATGIAAGTIYGLIEAGRAIYPLYQEMRETEKNAMQCVQKVALHSLKVGSISFAKGVGVGAAFAGGTMVLRSLSVNNAGSLLGKVSSGALQHSPVVVSGIFFAISALHTWWSWSSRPRQERKLDELIAGLAVSGAAQVGGLGASMFVGAGAGAVCGPVGAILGSLIGGIVGSILGGLAAENVAKSIQQNHELKEKVEAVCYLLGIDPSVRHEDVIERRWRLLSVYIHESKVDKKVWPQVKDFYHAVYQAVQFLKNPHVVQKRPVLYIKN